MIIMELFGSSSFDAFLVSFGTLLTSLGTLQGGLKFHGSSGLPRGAELRQRTSGKLIGGLWTLQLA